MSQDAGVSDRYRKTSPWPLFVALGLAVSEVGIFVGGLYPVAVAGLLLFVGSVAGIVTEAGYARHPWKLVAALGAVLVVGGLLVVASQVGSLEAAIGAVAGDDTIVVRGFAIAGAGIVAAVAGATGTAFDLAAGPLAPE